MNKYYVTTDQTADFPESLMEDCFRIIPMSYAIDGIVYDGCDTPFLTSEEFYATIFGGKISTTSMVSVETATAFFENIFAEGFDILHISFSSALSGSYNSYLKAAELAKTKYPKRNIQIVDSRGASAGEGLLVYYALKKRMLGLSLDENTTFILDLRGHIGHAFTVDDMYHLYRGGRVSHGTALVGNAIKIKPVLMVNEAGQLIPTTNVLGRKIAIRSLVDKMVSKGSGFHNDVILIGHGDCYKDALSLKNIIFEKFGHQNVVITDIGAVIGSHCGKGVLALFFLASDKVSISK